MIEWTEQATRQLDQAHDYILLSNREEVAGRIRMQIVTSVQQFATFPMSGRSGRRVLVSFAHSCWSAICTASRARGNWRKSCACIWRGAGSRDSASTRKFRTTLRFPRTGMDDFRNRICFKSSLRRLSPAE